MRFPTPDAADYKVILNTDNARFGSLGRGTPDFVYPRQPVPMYGRDQSIQIYLPSRSAQVLAPIFRK